jgi:tRNA-2-methylthio-N6-dimethylallyladenosine synthase
MLSTGENSARTVFLETFGCQMNENDSGRMLGILKGNDFRVIDRPDKADLIILNTCSIRDKAEQKVYSMLGRFKSLKKENPGLVICVAGCVAQQEGTALLKRVKYLDLVVGPHNIHRLGELLEEVSPGRSRVSATELTDGLDPDEFKVAEEAGGVKAFVSIMRGCNNFCAYCIVPYTRGREASRPSADIIEEVRRLASSGVREVTLLGQNVNSYGTSGGGDVSFPGLLKLVAGVEGIERVRFITSHPKDISPELISLFGDESKLARHIHLPVQSGSDEVLKRMGRVYTAKEYVSTARLLMNLYKDMAVTTDIIVGFPGETEDDFKLTMELVENLRFDNIFSFMYSQRPGTRAADFDGHLPNDLKSERLKTLQETQRRITMEKSAELVGSTLDVLIEGPSKADPIELSGRTTCNRIVNFSGTLPAGEIASVLITDAYPNSLRGLLNERGVLCC